MSREMKDSGIDWIGRIPENWVCCKQKHVMTMINGRAYKDSEFENNGKYRILRVGNVYSNPVWYSSSLELPDDKYCNDGDLLYTWSMSYGPVIWRGEKVIYHYHIWKVALDPSLDKMFAYYYLSALTEAIMREVHETTMGFVTMNSMNNAYIAYPDIIEQKIVAECLDSKCSIIDSAISKHHQIIEKLEEYRKAVITQAVTKGLNPNVEMKDSGNMIIGTIPSSWQCPPLKMLLSDNENNMRVGPFGSSLPSRIFQDDGPWVYNQRCVLDNNFEATDVHIPEWKFEEMKSFAVYPGDMLITTRGTIGKVAIVPHDAKKGILHPCLIRFRLDNAKILNEYVQYVFNGTDIVMNQIKQASGSTTIEALYSGPLRSIKLPTPSVEEQHYIVSWLNIKCKKIAKTIEAHNQLISKLQEYKQSLIYNAVTGKIDCTTEASI